MVTFASLLAVNVFFLEHHIHIFCTQLNYTISSYIVNRLETMTMYLRKDLQPNGKKLVVMFELRLKQDVSCYIQTNIDNTWNCTNENFDHLSTTSIKMNLKRSETN